MADEEKVGLWTQLRLKTADWTIMHWAALGSVVTLGLSLLDRATGKKKK
jgi:hypothetical protein